MPWGQMSELGPKGSISNTCIKISNIRICALHFIVNPNVHLDFKYQNFKRLDFMLSTVYGILADL